MRWGPSGEWWIQGAGYGKGGVKKTGLAIDALAELNCASWAPLSVNTIFGQGSWDDKTFDLYTYTFGDAAPVKVGDGGASVALAGGGVWAAQLGDGPIRGSGMWIGGAGLRDVDRQGRIICVAPYHNPVDIIVRTPNTAYSFPINRTIWGVQGVGQEVVYSTGDQLHVLNRFSARSLPTAFFRACMVDGRIFVVHNNGDRLVVYELKPDEGQPLEGWIISADGKDFNPDITANNSPNNGWLTVISSSTPSEASGDERIYAQRLAEPTVRLDTPAEPNPAPVDPEPPMDTPTDPAPPFDITPILSALTGLQVALEKRLTTIEDAITALATKQDPIYDLIISGRDVGDLRPRS